MNGAVVIDKPEGMTSHDVVARVRRILKTKRVGHTGTLDPFATGVLVLLVGQATRLAQFVDKDEKEYEALVRFGFETDTGDRTGLPKSQVPSPKSVSLSEIDSVLEEFRGEIEQVPPMYSAKKVAGKKLYELARQGQEIDRSPNIVKIYELERINHVTDEASASLLNPGGTKREPPRQPKRLPPLLRKEGSLNPPPQPLDQGGEFCVTIHVVCSAGTYIRTLAEDIGRKIGVGAHLQELRRTRAGRFDLARSMTLEELESVDDPASVLVPMAEIVSHLPAVVLPEERIEKTRSGMSSRVLAEFTDGEHIRIMNEVGSVVAIGTFDEAEKSVRPKIVLI